MRRMSIAAFSIFISLAALCHAQSSVRSKLKFDLSQIGFVLKGQQVCEDKGRLQDYPSKTMDQIIAAGAESIPVLIGMITDSRMARTREPIICYWPGMAIGDIAFCTLSDLFTDSTYARTTIPGANWNDLLGPAAGRPAWEQLHEFVEKRGRNALQAKWRRLWDRYGTDVYWDAKERCFRLKGQ